MIIDADVHLSPTGETSDDILIDRLIRDMDRAGVDKALTWLRPPYMREIAPSNHYVYEAMKQYPERILGFGWVDPHLGINRMKDEIKRCIQEYGFYGIKLNGAQNNFYIDDPQIALPLIEAVVQTGTHLAFHIGTDAYEMTHPYRLGRIARMFPEARIFMVHMGGVGFSDLSKAAIEVLLENPNITGIGSAIRHQRFKSHSAIGRESCLFWQRYTV